MSLKQVFECDGCGKQSNNPLAEAGWIHVDGPIVRSLGKEGFSGHETERLASGRHDFCSLSCLNLALQGVFETQGNQP